jgi:tetratricopeptide (TPR) repeat protein
MNVTAIPGQLKHAAFQLFLLCCFFCINSMGFSQQAVKDSLETVLKTTGEDTTRVNTLNSIARISIHDDLKKAKDYADKAAALAKKLNSADDRKPALKGLANAYHVLGIVAFYEDNYPEALANYSESLSIRQQIGDKKGIAASSNNMAIIYNDLGKYQEALKNHYLSLKIEEEIGDKQAQGLSYNNIGIIYEEQQEYEEAIPFYEKAITLAKDVDDKQGMANAYNNIGIVRKKQGRYDEALHNYAIALDLRKELGYPKGIFESYNNIALVYYTLGDYSESLKNHELSLAISTKANNELGMANSHLNMGIVYLKQKKFAESEKALKSALAYYLSIQYKQNILEAYESLTALYDAKKDYKKAMDYLRLYVSQKDSLVNDKSKKELMQSAMQYEYEKKSAVAKVEQEKKEAIQHEELEKRDAQIKLYIALCILILILFVAVFLQMRNRRRTEKLKLENSLIDLEQKALRLQMNPHFIFNALNSIQGFITENNQASAKKYLSKFARLMRLIMENSALKTVTLQNEIDVLNDYLELTTLRFPGKFSFNIEVDEDIDASNAEIPPMLLQPFVENAVLHGMAAKESEGLIKIRFHKKNGLIECSIEDNGIGRQKAMESKIHGHKSTGMLVTEERLKAFSEASDVKAKLQIIDLFDNFGKAGGTKVILEIPMQLTWT